MSLEGVSLLGAAAACRGCATLSLYNSGAFDAGSGVVAAS
jgi:hypothetical protein